MQEGKVEFDVKDNKDPVNRSVSVGNLRQYNELKRTTGFLNDVNSEFESNNLFQNLSSVKLQRNSSLDETRLHSSAQKYPHKINTFDPTSSMGMPSVLSPTGSSSLSPISSGSFKSRAGLDGNSTTMANDDNMRDLTCSSQTDISDFELDNINGFQIEPEASDKIEIPDTEEDEEFQNVDEIDGPISNNNIVEDNKNFNNNNQISTDKNEVDYNMPIDAQLKKSLEERAADFEKSTEVHSIATPKIDWHLKNYYGLERELPEWFTLADYTHIPQTKSQFDKHNIVPGKFINDEDYARTIIQSLLENLIEQPSSNIMALSYIALGINPESDSVTNQLNFMKRNNLFIVEIGLDKIVKSFFKIASSCRDANSNLRKHTVLLFYSSTILFCIISICIEERNNNEKIIKEAISTFDKLKLLQFLTKYIEHWRWNSRLSMRIRNIISLLFKALTLQFGDQDIYRETKYTIEKVHGIKRSEGCQNMKLDISPLHYQAFREDIVSRYPDFDPPSENLPKDIDNSNSLSQFLEIPRSKVRNPINMTLAVPEQHLATPAPSPPSSPTFFPINPSSRPRKSFQTNMAYPCLYPSDNESGDDDLTKRTQINESYLDKDIVVPYSIQEATKILSDNLRIKLSNKQLWHERDLFMMSERGWNMDRTKGPYNYKLVGSTEENEESIEIMKRIESYYEDCLPSFNSLVFVLLQTMESNMSNIDYRIADIGDIATEEELIPQLEISRAKEISLKSSSGILYQMLIWFKLNHILKFEYLCVLLYDSRFINISTTILNKYSEAYLEKVFDRMMKPKHSIWKECSKYCQYETSDVAKSHQESCIDDNILASFTYMFKILKKITGSKTQRLKELPLSIGLLFRRYFRAFNLDVYHPILKIVKELTPFKNKRWKSEHMELISGVYLYEKLELIDNWVTGKDISNELSDACGQEIALRALLQFYNFFHYEEAMAGLGYGTRTNVNQCLLNKETDTYSV
ncbi:hypothetical protein Kpol_1048p13 [Vanderwaltozyma polyspora DSM 70294]|uniref:Factor arrest protein 11 n=1 Tax=Vanderwaltozyma polyspora (strain ATCC 22028 / DSM 70294 / BCRC 21397 / CBS 2163 / NBRC 10782 / NRRL Y-8283 / UCD 57-17) TaxID=436907 RepID=A7TGH6_VANPO|nr:uncharacterized protein Kpol_1048p13 [Vanderwaltozyma polyspora DSM 70294]EDO18583.1 hypothetical protein Kpol_1048p13 [Vanderwaltozyma polyspora DSM 70294]